MTRLLVVWAVVGASTALSQSLGVLGQPGAVSLQRVTGVPANSGGTLIDDEGNAWSKPGSIACSGPGTNGSPAYYFDPGSTPGQVFLAVDHAGGGVQALVWNEGQSGGAPRISLFHVVCGQPQVLLGALDLTASTTPSVSTSAFGYIDLLTALDPQGRFCLPSSDGVYCFGPGTPLAAQRLVSNAQARAQLAPANVDWGALFPRAGASAVESALRFGPLTFGADGTLYALFDVELAEPLTGGAFNVTFVRWLVERSPAGVLSRRWGPEAISQTGSAATARLDLRKTLSAVNVLAIDEARSVLLAFPRRGRRFQESARLMRSIYDGVGVATFPLHALDGGLNDEPGHLELSQVFEQAFGNPTSVTMKQGRDAGVTFVLPAGVYRLGWDPATVDMDEDGLGAAEEQALGTSDFAKDSDGAGVRDGLEVRLYGSDPASAADDEGLLRWPARDLEYAYSPLIRERLDVEIHRQTWPSDYLCGLGTCWDRAGTKVLMGAGFNGPFVTEDGAHAIANTGTDFRRYALPAGTSEPIASVGDLTALVPNASGLEPIPAKGQRVYVVGEQRVVAFGDGPARVVFDLADEQCRSKLGSCGPPLLDTTVYQPDVYVALSALGFDPVIDRVLVLARGKMDTVVLAVAPGKAPLVLARGNDFPEVVVDTGSGMYPTAQVPQVMTSTAGGWLWSRFDGATGLVNGDYVPFDSPNIPPLAGFPGRGWDGDSLYVSATGGPTARGLLELVPMRDELDPGDVLVFAGPSSLDVGTFQPSATRAGPYLYRVGRRGGVDLLYADVWNRPGTFNDTTAIRGMGLAADGRVCATGVDGRLHELRTIDPATRLPTEKLTFTSVTGAADCLYDPEGKLHVLLDSPPGVLVMDTRTQDPAQRYDINGMSMPSRFVRLANGQYRIADAAGPLACADAAAGTLETSSRSVAGLTVGMDGALYVLERPTGALVKLDAAGACSGGAATPMGFDAAALVPISASPAYPWVVASLAERPDGRFVIMPSRSRLVPYDTSGPINEPMYLYFFNPKTGAKHVAPVDFGFAAVGSALALVPGASWRDPWGAGTGGGSGATGGGAGGTGGGGGGSGGGGSDGPPPSCGCGVVAEPLLALLGLGLLRRRRRARG